MNKFKRYLGRIIAIGIVLGIIFMSFNESFDYLRKYMPLFWIISIIWGIYLRLKYRNKKTSNLLRIRTNNDDYNRIIPFIFGIILPISGLFALKFMESDKVFWTLIIVTGILLLLFGSLFMPSGIIEIKNSELNFENGSEKKSIEVEKIRIIQLNNREIILYDNNENKHYLSHLNLNESDYKNISDFLKSKFKNDIEIKT